MLIEDLEENIGLEIELEHIIIFEKMITSLFKVVGHTYIEDFEMNSHIS